MDRTNVFLGDVDRARIAILQERHELQSAGAAVRLALRLAVPENPLRQPVARSARRRPRTEEGE